jgi:hypothetical protein
MAVTLGLGLVTGACIDSTGPNGNGNGNGPPITAEVLVLNSLSKTISRLVVRGDALETAASPIILPPQFDGVAMDVLSDIWVTTISAAGGSQILFGSFATGEQAVTTFPGAAGALADPSKPSLVIDLGGTVGTLVGTRGDNSIYIAFPGSPSAQLLAADVGEFTERVISVAAVLLSIDANLDDAGGTFQPLGDPRIGLYRFTDGSFFDEIALTGAVNANDALVLGDDVLVLAGGGFGPAPDFAPNNDGQLVIANAAAREVISSLAVQGNGIAMEPGLNGFIYVTRTTGSDFGSTDVLSFNLQTRTFARGPNNPIRPRDASGADLNCWAATSLLDGRLLCITFSAGASGRLALLSADGAFLDDIPVGQGAVDLIVR